MNTVILEIPEAYARSFGATDEEAARNARLELAIQMYREGKWSMGKAAGFARLYLGRFMDLLRERQIAQPYTKEMLEQDIRHACGRL